MILPSQPSVPDFAAQSGKLTGRAVLDKMFGHLRPHLNIPPGVDLRTSGSAEEQELETNLVGADPKASPGMNRNHV